MVTSRRKSTCGKTFAIRRAAVRALREDRCSRLMLGSCVSSARKDAIVIARPSECGGREALYAARPCRVPSACTSLV